VKEQLLQLNVKEEYRKLESQIDQFDYKTAMETLGIISAKTGISLEDP